MTISSNVMPSANSTQSHSKADLSVDTVSTETSACEGEVEKSLLSNDVLPSHSQGWSAPSNVTVCLSGKYTRSVIGSCSVWKLADLKKILLYLKM